MFEDRKIWIPDTFVYNSKGSFVHETPASTGGRSFLRVQNDGSVLASFL